MGGFGQAKSSGADLHGVERDLSIKSHSIDDTDIINMEIGEQNLPFENSKFRDILAGDICEHLDKLLEVVD